MRNDYLDRVIERYRTFTEGEEVAAEDEDFSALDAWNDTSNIGSEAGLCTSDDFEDLLNPPNTEQQAFLDLVFKFNPPPVIVLRGSGGTGKTWTLANMARGLSPEKVLILSVTHQARTVLEEELRRSGGLRNTNTATVAGFLRRQPDREAIPDHAYDNHFSDDTAPTDPSQYSVVVVDEVFMVPKRDVEDILQVCARNNVLPVVLAGDPAQLPPVNAESCIPFLDQLEEDGTAKVVALHRNKRASPGPLAELIDYVREHHELLEGNSSAITFYDNLREFIRRAVEEMNEANGDETKVPLMLAWRKITVGKMMLELRKAMGLPENWAVPGDILRLDSAFSPYNWRAVFDYLRSTGFDNAYEATKPIMRSARLNPGTLFRVLSTEAPRELGVAWAVNKTTVMDAQVEVLNGPHKSARLRVPLAEFSAKLDELSETTLFLNEVKAVVDATCKRKAGAPVTDQRVKALLNQITNGNERGLAARFFFDVRDERLCFTMPSSTLTVHRAQGSGRDHVFVLWDDLKGNEQDELRYVAVSRAKQHLHIFKR